MSMRSKVTGKSILLLLVGTTALSCAFLPPAHAASCDSNCLLGTMQRFLRQMTLHQPGNLRIAPGALLIENAKPTDTGHGSWVEVTKIRSGQSFADPSTGEVADYGAVDTIHGLGSLFVRLKVKNGAIAEQEIFSKGGEPPMSAAAGPAADFSGLLEPDILYTAVVPPDRRLPRAGLIATVRLYLRGIGEHNGSLPSFSYRCDRYSAGTKFTNNPNNPISRGGGTCAGSIQNLKGQTPANVRFPIVDEKLGIVIAMFIIPHAERHPQGATNVGEVFKIVDGKIRSIEEFSFVGGYPPSSGFRDE